VRADVCLALLFALSCVSTESAAHAETGADASYPPRAQHDAPARVDGSRADDHAGDHRGGFARGQATLELAGVLWLESWNKNGASDRLLGGHVALAHSWWTNWQLVLELELLRADLADTPDAFLLAASGLARRRMSRVRGAEPFVEWGVGLSAATAPVPVRGTTFNYLLQAGMGLARPLGTRWSAVASLRVWHLSNGGTIRGDARNPDLENIGGYVGLQFHVGSDSRRPPRSSH
jgi:hypothetical protein